MSEFHFHGLSQAEVDDRIHLGKDNKMNKSISKSRREIVLEHSLTYFNFLNLFLAVLIAATGQFKNLTFVGVVFFNTAIGIIQEFKVKKLIDQISVMTAMQARVIREGEQTQIDIEQVVMDDILLLEGGDQICADCKVLEADGCDVNESMITGESRPVRKNPGDTLMSGSYVISGSAACKVFHVGEENYAVQLAKKAKIKKRAASEMQRTIRKIIWVDSILLIPVGILLYLSQKGVTGISTGDAIVKTVAGVIGMIPEGLVLLTSVSFVIGVGRLASRKALVQEMESIEALARVDVLCLDKTGTVTTGNLEVTEILPLQKEIDLKQIETIMGETAYAFRDSNATQKALKKRFRRHGEWIVQKDIPFSGARKFRAVSFGENGTYVLGAPEMLLPDNEEIGRKVLNYSEKGLRVLLLAECQMNMEESTVSEVKEIALLTLADEIRKEASDTFEFFREQKVQIRIVSGDHPVTVSRIAEKAGLENAQSYVDAGTLPHEFTELCQEVEKYTIFGRVKPEQKQDIVKALQTNGHVVGMVGDGVNDVLALKEADCGIAMAAGSDAAKQVAHIVLLDSNFASMKSIVSEGRTIISNIEKVSALYLTKTIYSILLCIMFIFLQREYPFIPIQLSLISTVAIGIPSFLLTLEKEPKQSSAGFLRHVMKISLPAALTMVISILIIQGISMFWPGDLMQTSTFNLMTGGLISLLVVFRVCQPMNSLHKGMCIALPVLFLMGMLIVPGLLGIYPVFSMRNLLIIPLACMVFCLRNGFSELFDWIDVQLRNTISRNDEQK